MTELECRVYADDCLVDGNLQLPDGTRLTDYLNKHSELPLTKVRLTALDDSRVVEIETLLLSTDDIHGVEATDTGSQVGRRIRTRSSEADIVIGPYRVHGYVHGPTAGDPLASLSRRQAMLPVTGARIAFILAGELEVHECDVIIVNRLHADIAKPEGEAPSILDKLGLSPADPNAKDLTGELSSGRRPTRE